MEYFIYVIYAFALFFIVKRFMPVKGVDNISATELKAVLKDKNKQFVDVRTPAEFKGNNISGFKNIPLHTLGQKAKHELSIDKEVVVICQSGMRSQKASKTLRKLGFAKVTNVKGGMNAWR
ncbi:Rhodanese-related sulfurtransferase [Gracilibacillus ureilyticus]|uniref:Rhodanese-related sulfurtransferase n=1 Tax=Gracilibacillus ureilyticus TaxID=531814 RepID=A0A1H9U013_9BACI|nr:rhodanese-like domain-containing protein [Gracilibacillus ureilyticus]SES03000.1 Rhodanese-related sulfurtransferase [Gracilibacillus ureilyticus]